MVPSKCRPGRGSRAAPGPVGATVRAARGGWRAVAAVSPQCVSEELRLSRTRERESGLFPAVAQRRSSARCRVGLLLPCWRCRPRKFNEPAVSMHLLESVMLSFFSSRAQAGSCGLQLLIQTSAIPSKTKPVIAVFFLQ